MAGGMEHPRSTRATDSGNRRRPPATDHASYFLAKLSRNAECGDELVV
jgi:hypothetical protein